MVSVKIMQGDVLARLKELPDNSVHCVVTSPPYWGLRDYGIDPVVWGGEPGCEHEWGEEILKSGEIWNAGKAISHGGTIQKNRKDDPEKWSKVQHKSQFCRLCGAWRGSLGLEPTISLFVEHIVEGFREVRRVLRPDGVCFVNLGDSYTSGGRRTRDPGQSKIHPAFEGDNYRDGLQQPTPPGLKPKDLCGVPWRVALALQADGWWLRSDIIWNKPNPMPESVTDRPTRSHEYIFLLTKSAKYFWDAEEVREESGDKMPYGGRPAGRINDPGAQGKHGSSSIYRAMSREEKMKWYGNGRNLRSVWTIATAPFPGEYCKACKSYYPQGWRKMKKRPEEEDGEGKAICPKCGSWEDWVGHFATFGSELVKTCIKAGTSEHGVCPKCGAPWVRVVEKKPATMNIRVRDEKKGILQHKIPGHKATDEEIANYGPEKMGHSTTLGWRPSCYCYDYDHPKSPVPATVLDPFGGAGTTGLVAAKMGRNAILIEIKPDYCDMAAKRINADLGMMVICST